MHYVAPLHGEEGEPCVGHATAGDWPWQLASCADRRKGMLPRTSGEEGEARPAAADKVAGWLWLSAPRANCRRAKLLQTNSREARPRDDGGDCRLHGRPRAYVASEEQQGGGVEDCSRGCRMMAAIVAQQG